MLLMLISPVGMGLQAQNSQSRKLAVRTPMVGESSEPVSGIELSIVRSRFRDAVSNMSGIELIDRTDVNNILEELKFQQSGFVSDDDKRLLGMMKGVDIIVSLVVTKGAGYFNIEAAFLDVQTANVLGSTKSVLVKADDPLELEYQCVELAKKLTGITYASPHSYPSSFTGGDLDNDLLFFVNEDIVFKMIFVKGGAFQMVSWPHSYDVRTVTVSDYYMGEFEVTQALWQEVMGTSIYQQRDKANASWPIVGVGANNPIYYVNYTEAEDFCKRLNQRLRGQKPSGYNFSLPTEAEWEYAARGGNKSVGYTYSGSYHLLHVGWYTDNSDESTHPVGLKKSNELGLYDMCGNVCEWCTDWYVDAYGDYSNADQTNPIGPNFGSRRVLRGGSFFSSDYECQVFMRNSSEPDNRNGYGFRLALVRR